MELDEEEDDHVRGAQNERPGGDSDQEMHDGDTIQIEDVTNVGRINGASAPSWRHSGSSDGIKEFAQSRGTRASATPLFVSSREASTGPKSLTRSESSSRQSMVFPEGASFAVFVSPVSRRWEYQTLDHDPRVASILEEVNNAGEISYVIECRDGRHLRVSTVFETHNLHFTPSLLNTLPVTPKHFTSHC